MGRVLQEDYPPRVTKNANENSLGGRRGGAERAGVGITTAPWALHLLGQEYQEDKEFRTNTARYIAETQRELLPWQQPDGGWPNKAWIKDRETTETNAYATAFATMTLFVPERRLSIYNRTPPKLPKIEE